jgi:RHS repeat-associated protein
MGSFVNPGAQTDPANALQQAPKAYLCVLFFDERFRFDEASSRVYPVGYEPGKITTIDRRWADAIGATKNGYAYVYFTNESGEPVYFDNFFLSHERGAILEETHYYPFGLTMAGISSRAAGGLSNKKKYQQYELTADLDINLYESFYRSHDPQLGRFWQIDPKPKDFESLYAAMGNNPMFNIDVLGDTLRGVNATSAERALEMVRNSFNGFDNSTDLVNLFSLAGDGVSFASIDEQAFMDAYDQLGSDEAKELAYGYYSMINSDQTHFTAVLNLSKKEKLDLSEVKYMGLDLTKSLKGHKIGTGMNAFSATNGGGGQTFYSKAGGQGISILAMDPVKQISAQVISRTGKTSAALYTPSASFLFTHEVIGHGLADQTAKNIPNALDRYWYSQQSSVQVNNIYYKAHGMNYYDTGSGHMPLNSNGQRQIMPRNLTIGIPSFLKFIR